MTKPITPILHDFLHTRKILAEVARRIDKNLSTLASEINPNAGYAKFGIDEFEPLCKAVREIGYGKEMDGILHVYFEELKGKGLSEESTDNLSVIASNLMAKTAMLADGATKLMNKMDAQQLREIQKLIQSELIPTAVRLGALIDQQLEKGAPGIEPAPEST